MKKPITRAETEAMFWRAYQQGNDNKVQQETPKVPSGIEKGSATKQPVISSASTSSFSDEFCIWNLDSINDQQVAMIS